MKKCSTCGNKKDKSEFRVAKGGNKVYLRGQCKDCEQAYRDANKARNKKWREENAEYLKQQSKEYYEKNKEALSIYHANWRADNKEHLKAKRRLYNIENSEENKRRIKEWCEQNPEKMLTLQRNRRARLRDAEGYHTGEEILQMYHDQEGLCAYCEKPLNYDYHVDHIIPLSAGGTNWWDNLAITCPDCNRKKHTTLVEEFMEELMIYF